MTILQQTISSLSKEEIINYKLYAKRTQNSKYRKDMILFDLIKKQTPHYVNDDVIFNKLYPKTNTRNVYYQLKNRLLLEVNNSLVQFYFQETDTHYIYSELSLYKIFFAKNEWGVAVYHLNKAEKKALEIQDFSMLDVIYTEQINLSIQYSNDAPSEYKKKREANRVNLDSLRILDDALADVIYELRRSQTFSKSKGTTLVVLDKSIKQLNSKKEFKNNLSFKSKLFNAISRLLLSKQDYEALEKYTISTYDEFITQQYFTKNNHNLKLQLLVYICNTLFVNQKHELALDYAKKLGVAMKEFKNILYDNYVFFYYNSLVNNYTILNPQKSVEVLNEAKEIKAITEHPTHLGYVYLNLAGAYFDLKQYKLALKNIIKLYSHKAYSSMDDGFKLQINITEVVVRIELKDFEYAHKLLQDILKAHQVLLKTKDNKEEYDFLTLLLKMIHTSEFIRSKRNSGLVQQFCDTAYQEKRNSIIKYKPWLASKFNLSE